MNSGSTWSESDRRRRPRAAWGGEASLQCSGQEFILTARNVSEGGMQADSEFELPVSALGIVSFQLTPGSLPVACRCRVIYSIDGKGAGIEFLDVSDEARWTLKSFVDEAN